MRNKSKDDECCDDSRVRGDEAGKVVHGTTHEHQQSHAERVEQRRQCDPRRHELGTRLVDADEDPAEEDAKAHDENSSNSFD